MPVDVVTGFPAAEDTENNLLWAFESRGRHNGWAVMGPIKRNTEHNINAAAIGDVGFYSAYRKPSEGRFML